MKALAFWKVVTVDQEDLLERIVALLGDHQIRFCVIGGQAVNAYVEPVVSLDLDLAVASDQVDYLEASMAGAFVVRRFPHSLNVSSSGSDLRVRFRTDPRYAAFVERADERDVLGLTLPVACVEDVLRGKVWAAGDPQRRASKRQKDLADIARLLEAYPRLRAGVPEEILARLL